MEKIVTSLFGVDPAALRQAQQTEDFARAYKFAQLDPMQQAQFSLYQGGAGLGRSVSGFLGGDDQMQRATQVRQLASQFDMGSAEGLRQFAQAVAPISPDVAQAAIKRSDEIITTGLKQAELQTQAIRNIATANQAKRPEIAQLQSYRDELIAELGADHPKVKEVNETIKGVAKGRGTNIVLPGEAQDKILREKRTGKLLDLEDASIIASDTLQLTRDFNNVLGKAFTGIGSGAKLTAAQFANALGVSVTGTSESEQLDQLFAALTVGQAKNLKGALSDKDVKFLKEAVGSRGLTRETLQNVVERIERNALIDQRTYDLASAYTGDMAKLNINEFRKQAQTEVNTTFEKRKRLQELRQKAGQQSQ